MSDVRVLISGINYFGWSSLSLSKSMTDLAHTLSLSVKFGKEGSASSTALLRGSSIKVFVDDTPVFTGYIEKNSLSLADRSIQISCRSKTADLIDCSVKDASQLKELTTYQLFSKLSSPFGVKVISLVDSSQKVSSVNVKAGETPFEIMSRIANENNIILQTNGLGNLVMTSKDDSLNSTFLIEGENIIDASFSDDSTGRFSEYICKSQDSTNNDNSGTAKDSGVERYRPKVMINEKETDSKGCEERAKREANLANAKSQSLDVTLFGWTDRENNLWDVNQLLKVKIPFFGLNTNLLISSLTFNKDLSNGTTTNMKLIRPDSFEFKPPKEVKKGDDLIEAIRSAKTSNR